MRRNIFGYVLVSPSVYKVGFVIVGFVFGQKGLMTHVTLEGSKYTKLKK